jgi:hypothetical protein
MFLLTISVTMPRRKIEELLEYGGGIFTVLTNSYWEHTLKALSEIQSGSNASAFLL